MNVFKSTFLTILLLSSLVLAQGRIIIPEQPPREIPGGTVILKDVNTNISISDGAAKITLEQNFYNTSSRRLEGEYLYPLPGDAHFDEFYLYIDGTKTRGQLLPADQARESYLRIVRSLRDPALLEYVGGSLFKARIFPIEPKSERKIELRYNQILKFNSGVYRLSLPLRQSGQADIARFKLKALIQSDQPIGNVYSPSHEIQVQRVNSRRVTVTLNSEHMAGDKDFILYFDQSPDEINGTLLSFRPRTDRDGYFMLLLSPQQGPAAERPIARDVVFAVDVSGSMNGEKIDQARQALRFCVNALQAEDRFDIISFSSATREFKGSLLPASADNKQNAAYFIDNLSASGGTNINLALKQALMILNGPKTRPAYIVFITDGLPTEGEQDVARIIQNVTAKLQPNMRLFSFGVGFDVNTYLLDRLSADSHGDANYVKPGENIEREISTFFSAISDPVLSDVHLAFDSNRVHDIYPQKLPDLFKGQRQIIFGRYGSSGRVNATLSGRQGDRKKSWNYELRLARRETDNGFVAKLWANRKVAALLDQIRFNGENPELVQSIKTIAEEYGIVTPYTSYLVREQENEMELARQRAARGSAGSSGLQLLGLQNAREMKAEQDEEAVGSAVFFDALASAPKAAENSYGKGAVMSSRIQKKMSATEQADNMLLNVKNISGKTFILRDGIWTEKGLQVDSENTVTITFLSRRYFELIDSYPQLKHILALGDNILFEWQGRLYRIENSATGNR